jgi:hypothetical protein
MVAISYVGFVVGQVLILPLSPGLTGQDDGSENADAVATRLLGLMRSANVEA